MSQQLEFQIIFKFLPTVVDNKGLEFIKCMHNHPKKEINIGNCSFESSATIADIKNTVFDKVRKYYDDNKDTVPVMPMFHNSEFVFDVFESKQKEYEGIMMLPPDVQFSFPNDDSVLSDVIEGNRSFSDSNLNRFFEIVPSNVKKIFYSHKQDIVYCFHQYNKYRISSSWENDYC